MTQAATFRTPERLSLGPSAIFLGLFALGITLRLISFAGVQGSDDVSIASHAMRLLEHGPYVPEGHYAARVGLIYPLALVYAVFGVGELQTVVLPFFAAVLSLVLVYAIGRRLFGEHVGLLALLVLAVFPLDVQAATYLVPDLPMSAALGGAFYLILRGRDSHDKLLWGALAGLAWGWAYLIKIEAAFFAAPVLLLAALEPRARLTVFWACAFVGLILFMENALYFLGGGGVLHRLEAVQNTGGAKVISEYSAAQLWVFPKAWFITFYDFGLHYYFLFAAMIWALFSRRSMAYVLLLWLVVTLLWLQFGGNPFSENYSVKSHLLRYCSTVSIPMALLIALFFTYFAERGWRRAYWGSIAALTLAALFFVNFNTLAQERQQATKIALDYASANDLFPLYLDRTSKNVARLYLAGHPKNEQIHSLQRHNFQTQQTELIPFDEIDGYGLLNRGFMEYSWRRYGVDRPELNDTETSYDILLKVDNPGNRLAYVQARLLSFLGSNLIPVAFLQEKIAGTADAILQDGDALIIRPHD
jgi:hypothetical protein